MTDIWQIFPYPTMTYSSASDGSLLPVHADCAMCRTRDCLADTSSAIGNVRTCRYGISYARVDDDRVVNGVLAVDDVTPSKRAVKRLRREKGRRVASENVSSAVERARTLGAGAIADYQLQKNEILARLERDPGMHEALADQLRRDFESNLNQSHDFLQLVKLVRGHAETLLYDKFPSLSPEEAAEKLPTEGAIYFSTELMLVKMDSMLFLNEINRAYGNQSRFQVHPLILKYLRIYRWQADQKDLKLRIEGSCYITSFYNSQAIGAVIQGLMDNMVKYSPAGSDGIVRFVEEDNEVTITFGSLGPRIEPDEAHQIFLPKYRARAARRVEMSGMGVGLATAKRISDALELDLRMTQDPSPDRDYAERYWTTFSIGLQGLS